MFSITSLLFILSIHLGIISGSILTFKHCYLQAGGLLNLVLIHLKELIDSTMLDFKDLKTDIYTGFFSDGGKYI